MEVNDRIKIIYTGDNELSGIIAAQKNYITEQTMADSLETANGEGLNGSDELNINGRNCRVVIEKI